LLRALADEMASNHGNSLRRLLKRHFELISRWK
jgi:hypothetical protein